MNKMFLNTTKGILLNRLLQLLGTKPYMLKKTNKKPTLTKPVSGSGVFYPSLDDNAPQTPQMAVEIHISVVASLHIPPDFTKVLLRL